VLAVEMFEVARAPGTPRAAFLVNELAMRPHNSGHWSIDGAVTSQFEQHLRAVLDLPLGDPRPVAPWTVMANVLGGDYAEIYPAYRHVMARDPGAKVHMYGKGCARAARSGTCQRERRRTSPTFASGPATPPTTCKESSPNE
jgi:5-(carboxyamino)imidazole ribonucleotide synthase